MRPRRVVITGMGVVAPNGIGKEAFWDALAKGRSGVRRITLFDTTGLPTDVAGQVPEFDPTMFMPERLVRERGRASHLGVAAAQLALSDAGLNPQQCSQDRIDLMVGMTFPAMDYVEQFVHQFAEDQRYLKQDLYLLYTSVSPNMVAMDIAATCGIRGDRRTIANACSSGTLAIAEGYERIRRGEFDICLAGGVDASLTYLGFAALIAGGFHLVSDLPPEKQSRPYDQFRTGPVSSEGAAILVLESLEHAVARGANPHAEILGAGVCSYPPNSHPDGIRQGLANAMESALKRAGLSPADVDYICAHGPSLLSVDYMETLAIKDVFGSGAYRVPVSSIKSTIGNPMSASGPLQVAAAILAMENSTIPPTINLENPDPLCDLDYVPGSPRRNRIEISLVDSHGFDNVDAAVVLSRTNLRAG